MQTQNKENKDNLESESSESASGSELEFDTKLKSKLESKFDTE